MVNIQAYHSFGDEIAADEARGREAIYGLRSANAPDNHLNHIVKMLRGGHVAASGGDTDISMF
jgi:hypothetical protein